MKVTAVVFSALALLATTVMALPSDEALKELAWDPVNKRACCPLNRCMSFGCAGVSIFGSENSDDHIKLTLTPGY